MSTHNSGTENSIELRDVRALTECMSVLPEGDGEYTVVGQNGGGEYRVHVHEGACTCPDAQHRDVRCKHIRRVEYEIGERPIPEWVDRDAIDDQLGMHVGGTLRVTVADGGQVVAADLQERPEECECDDLPDSFPCWPCVRDGRKELPN